MLLLLAIIFVILSLALGGERTAKSLITLSLNAFCMMLAIFGIYAGFPPLVSMLLACFLIALITIFYQNGNKPKTVAAFFATALVTAIMSIAAYMITSSMALGGFPVAQFEIQEANGYSPNIASNMVLLTSCVILTILIGTVIDTSICISSSLYEIHLRNKDLRKQELFEAGMNIGKNILSSTVNTLFFIAFAEYLALFLQFADDYSFLDMINSKEFAQMSFPVLLGAIASILVIPVTSAICTYKFKTHLKNSKSIFSIYLF